MALTLANPKTTLPTDYSHFSKVNDQGLPVLDQAALDKVLKKYGGNDLNYWQYRENYNKIGRAHV